MSYSGKPIPIVDQVFPLLTDEWQSARQIHARLGTWAHSTVHNALRTLAESGRAEMKTDGRRALFMRVPPKLSLAVAPATEVAA